MINQVGQVLKKNDKLYCSECRMVQMTLKPYCFFCGTSFSNYENLFLEYYKLVEEDKIRGNLDDKNW